jgi:hypothetical protein
MHSYFPMDGGCVYGNAAVLRDLIRNTPAILCYLASVFNCYFWMFTCFCLNSLFVCSFWWRYFEICPDVFPCCFAPSDLFTLLWFLQVQVGVSGRKLEKTAWVWASWFVFLTYYVIGVTYQENEVGGTCGLSGGKRNSYKVLVGKPEWERCVEDQGIGGRTMLKWLLKKWDGRV